MSMTDDSNEKRYHSLASEVEDWVERSVGFFNIKDIYTDLRVETRENKGNTSKILSRLIAAKKVQRKDGKNGEFRRIASSADSINWVDADPDNVIKLRWVFGIERYVNIYSKNIILVAGAPNAGKSAYLLNFVHDNQDVMPDPINYYSSEMGAEELKMRIVKSGIPFQNWKFNAYSRSANFADVINPNGINVIDYLEITETFYKVGEEITGIFNNLDRGVAVIAVQKKRNTTNFKGEKVDYDLGRGAEFSLEKPRLYLSLDSGTCKIVKAKTWADTAINPNNMEFKFKLVNGYTFLITSAPNPVSRSKPKQDIIEVDV